MVKLLVLTKLLNYQNLLQIMHSLRLAIKLYWVMGKQQLTHQRHL